MALTREAAVFNPSSPRSSVGGAESFKGTPDTRLTAFSPEEGSAKSSRLLKCLGQDSPDVIPSPFSADVYGNATSAIERDPFITAESAAHQKLSPTASAFQPFSSPLDILNYVPAPDCGQRNVNSFSLGQKDEYELSQCLNIVSSTRVITVADLDACFAVSYLQPSCETLVANDKPEAATTGTSGPGTKGNSLQEWRDLRSFRGHPRCCSGP